jgi:ParB family transcriptional regulator, chromosome partitioning protein
MGNRTKRPSPILGAATALISETSERLVARSSRFRHTFEAPIDSISADPDQARKVFNEGEIKALAATMAEQGQLQPILLRRIPGDKPRWAIIAGERRWRAAALNGWTSMLAIEHDGGDAEILSLVENLQRVDLTPVEEARGLRRLIQDKGWTQNAAAEALGKSKSEVSAILRILSLPEDVLDGVLTSELQIPKNALIELARVENPSIRDRLLRLARSGLLTVQAIRTAAAGKVRGGGVEKGQVDAGRRKREVDARILSRLVTAIRTARTEGRPLTQPERDQLLKLRDEIEQRLSAAD